jgi:L-ascorbate metabolism protein UlaG (beta-lactamase superfamily)
VIVWFGHSSYLVHAGGKNILVDPVFSGYASPVPGLVKAFPGSNVYGIKDMPHIDWIIIPTTIMTTWINKASHGWDPKPVHFTRR